MKLAALPSPAAAADTPAGSPPRATAAGSPLPWIQHEHSRQSCLIQTVQRREEVLFPALSCLRRDFAGFRTMSPPNTVISSGLAARITRKQSDFRDCRQSANGAAFRKAVCPQHTCAHTEYPLLNRLFFRIRHFSCFWRSTSCDKKAAPPRSANMLRPDT